MNVERVEQLVEIMARAWPLSGQSTSWPSIPAWRPAYEARRQAEQELCEAGADVLPALMALTVRRPGEIVRQALTVVARLPWSRSAIPPLTRLLRDRDARVRQLACAALAVHGDANSWSDVRCLLDDPASDVRTQAVVTGRHIAPMAASDEMLTRPDDPAPVVLAAAAQLFAEGADRRAADRLEQWVASASPRLRRVAMGGLCRVAPGQAFRALIECYQTSPSPSSRLDALIALAGRDPGDRPRDRLSWRRAWPALHPLLGLAGIDHLERLARLVLAHQRQEVVEQLFATEIIESRQGLWRLDELAATPAGLDWADNLRATKPRDRDRALLTLDNTRAQYSSDDVLDTVGFGLADSDGWVVRRAAAIAQKAADPRAIPLLVRATRQEPHSHTAAEEGLAEAIGSFGQPGLTALIAALDDDNDEKRRARLYFRLERAFSRETIHVATAALPNVRGGGRSKLVELIGVHGTSIERDLLWSIAADRSDRAQPEAALALARLGDLRAVEPLVDFVRGLDARLAARALAALVRLDALEQADLVADLLRWNAQKLAHHVIDQSLLQAIEARPDPRARPILERLAGVRHRRTAHRARRALEQPAYI